MEFEQVNIYLRTFDVWSLKLFGSFKLIHYDCVRGVVTSFIRYLLKWIWFFVFQIKMKNKKQTSNLNFNVQYFENRITTYFDVFCLNFSIEAKIKTLFLISYFNLSKKKQKKPEIIVALGTRIRDNSRVTRLS